jgi:hypothetical protein
LEPVLTAPLLIVKLTTVVFAVSVAGWAPALTIVALSVLLGAYPPLQLLPVLQVVLVAPVHVRVLAGKVHPGAGGAMVLFPLFRLVVAVIVFVPCTWLSCTNAYATLELALGLIIH